MRGWSSRTRSTSRRLSPRDCGGRGYAVDVAHDGADALEKLGYNEYDLVCLDLTLPKVDGTEVCRRIRGGGTASTGARILMLTARDGVADRRAGSTKAPTTTS